MDWFFWYKHLRRLDHFAVGRELARSSGQRTVQLIRRRLSTFLTPGGQLDHSHFDPVAERLSIKLAMTVSGSRE